MKKQNFWKITIVFALAIFAAPAIFGQGNAAAPKPIIFAVLNDGKTLEPIALISKGKLIPASDGGDSLPVLTKFAKTYYRPKTTYQLIFGGASNGTVTVKSSNAKQECSTNQADVVTLGPSGVKLSGFVMGLATNALVNKAEKSFRRQPTPAERDEIERLVRAEFARQKIDASALTKLNYHNLTAMDANNDGQVELIGTFYLKPTPTSRAVLFFIADKNARSGKYSLNFSEFSKISQDEMMSGADIEAIDSGIYSQVLLDVLDYNGDKTKEIFTYAPGLEGTSFITYKRNQNGKWIRDFEGANYHCGF